MDIVTSRDNQKLKFARSVRDGREPGYIFLEGARLAIEAFRSGVDVRDVLIAEAFRRKDPEGTIFPTDLEGFGVTVVADRIFDSVADTKNSQGLVVIANRPQTSLSLIDKAIAGRARDLPLVIFLNEINNPSNLGAILRAAEGAGVSGVITSSNSADAFSPKALRGAMGASLRVPIAENTTLGEALSWARARGFTPVAADIHGNKSYTGIDWKRPRLLIFGSEAHGLRADEREEIEEIIHIPMAGGVESLNLAVSCGIVMFEARRQAGF